MRPSSLVSWLVIAVASCSEAYDAAEPAPDARGTDASAEDGAADAGVEGGDAGRVCHALELDGVDDFVEVPDAGELDPTGPSTVEAWVLLEKEDVPELHIVSHHDHDQRRGYVLMAFGFAGGVGTPPVLGGSARYYDGSSVHQVGFGAESVITPRQWTHVAASYDADKLRLYVDGIKRAESASVATHPNADFSGVLRIGRSALDNFPWGGRVREVRISSAARYTAPAFEPARRFAVDAYTIALYHLDEGAGIVARDATGRHDGTVVGAKWVESPCAP